MVPEKNFKKIFKVFFTVYGHGGHFGHVTINVHYKCTTLNLRSLNMEFEFNWPSGFITLNISSEKNDFGFNSIQKINFSKSFQFKSIRKQF